MSRLCATRVFDDVAFHNMTLAPNPQGVDEGDYWDHFLQYPFFVMIDGIKRLAMITFPPNRLAKRSGL